MAHGPDTLISSQVFVEIIAFRIDVPRLLGSCRWRIRCSSRCSRDAVDGQGHPRRGETP
jgi:hypothetical protein